MRVTRNVYHRGFLRYPYHCCPTSAGLRLDLCSHGYCNDLSDGNWVIHLLKTAGLMMKNQLGYDIPMIMHNLSQRALKQSQKRNQDQTTQKARPQTRTNQRNRKIASRYYLETIQKQERLIIQLKEQVIRFQWKPTEFVFVAQWGAHRLSELPLALYGFSPWIFLLFSYCSVSFTFFILIGGQ